MNFRLSRDNKSITIAGMNAQPHRTDKDVLIIEADDSINDDATTTFVENLENEVASGKHKKIILDCSKIEFLSSYGLSMILRLRNATNMAKGELKLCGLNMILDRLLSMSKVNHLFKQYSDVETARVAFGKPAR